MGGVLSAILKSFRGVSAIVKLLRTTVAEYRELEQRASAAPGLPTPSPTKSFWLDEPPFPELVDVQSPTLPEYADVAIIGSGITGAAIARSFLHELDRDEIVEPPRVVVLEARQLCSGATGRNGGHIKVSPHVTFDMLLASVPAERAAALVRFMIRHLPVLTELTRAEGISEAECREVETVDFFLDENDLSEALRQVETFHKWVPEFEIHIWTGPEARERYSVNEHIIGAVSYEAGALWPYRFVTAIWRDLLGNYSKSLSIETSTPVEAVECIATKVACAADAEDAYPYLVQTSRGTIRVRHVVHATNAFATQLVPGLRGKMTGLLAHMSAQRPGKDFPDINGSRSWSIMFGHAFDYITQRPTVDGVPGEIMLGGGFSQSRKQGADQLGVYNDARLDTLTVAHLDGIMPTVFSPRWGEDAPGGRIKRLWSGVVALSADLRPLVGKLDHRLTGRKVETSSAGEWIAAGYTGDGMVWAWLCGTALGIMLAGKEQEKLSPVPGRPGGALADWFPEELYARYERVQKMDLADLASML